MEVDNAEEKKDPGHDIHPVQNVSVPVTTSIILYLPSSPSIHHHGSIGSSSVTSYRGIRGSVGLTKVELVLVRKVLLQQDLGLLGGILCLHVLHVEG